MTLMGFKPAGCASFAAWLLPLLTCLPLLLLHCLCCCTPCWLLLLLLVDKYSRHPESGVKVACTAGPNEAAAVLGTRSLHTSCPHAHPLQLPEALPPSAELQLPVPGCAHCDKSEGPAWSCVTASCTGVRPRGQWGLYCL